MSRQKIPAHLLLFDGVCNLCNASVRFVLRHDKKERFFFSSLQSDFAGKLLAGYNISQPNSVIYIEHGRIYTNSTAVLRAVRHLRFPVNCLCALIIIPPFIRNAVYRIIASKRYAWFGRRSECMVPGKRVKHRFLE